VDLGLETPINTEVYTVPGDAYRHGDTVTGSKRTCVSAAESLTDATRVIDRRLCTGVKLCGLVVRTNTQTRLHTTHHISYGIDLEQTLMTTKIVGQHDVTTLQKTNDQRTRVRLANASYRLAFRNCFRNIATVVGKIIYQSFNCCCIILTLNNHDHSTCYKLERN